MGIILRNEPRIPRHAALARSLAFFSVAALAVFPSVAQEVQVEANVVQVVPNAPPAAPAAPNPDSTKQPTPAGKTPEEKRLEEVLKLKFDRSIISILRTQSALDDGEPAKNPVEQFRRNVVAGQWKEVGAFLKSLPEKDVAKVYEYLLKELDKVPTPQAAQPQPQQQQQQQGGPTPAPTLLVSEIADLADIAPGNLNDEQIKLLAALLKRVFAANRFVEPLIMRLEGGTAQLGGQEPAKRELAAQLFLEAGLNSEALKFLMPLQPGEETRSVTLLEKHARATFHLGRQEQKPEAIQRAWELNQLLLAAPNCPADIKDRAWRRYADIVRFLPPEIAAQSLKETFTRKTDEGLVLVKKIGTQVSDDRLSRETTLRKANLAMQRYAAESLIPITSLREKCQAAIDLFALHWSEEAEYAKRLHVPPRNQQMTQYDSFGNPIFYGNQPQVQQSNSNQLPAISIPELLPTAPSADWLAALNPALRVRVLVLLAELHLKLEDDVKALPYVEQLVLLQPKESLRISNELLRVWATTHDPQRNSGARRSYYGPYGFVQQGIPLTRALQQRNLDELSTLLNRLRALPIGTLENEAIVNAFTMAHSQAEVFRKESIELVFGKLEQLAPDTLAELLQTMRQRLATQWRRPNIQQQAKTQRTDAQIDAEVLRGYELLTDLIEKGLERQPEDWRLNLAQAATWFDLAEFQYGKKVDLAIYVEKRDRAFAAFEHASKLYAAKLPSMDQKSETPLVYQQWLNANLGASDLALVTRQQEPSEKNIERIRKAILSLPGNAGERHLDALAKAVASSADSLPPHLKPGYTRAALSVVQNRPDSEKIRELVSYHDGLLREIELSLRVDGDTTVGNAQPFGAFLTVRHTAELERESAGGFSKYLRNQSQGQYYYNPYGTPPVDHRDELEKQMREKFSERFEVLSITFHDEKVQSRGYGREGWRETPLAYILLKAKDGAVDRIPSIRLDVDFLDKYGPVVLPVESPVQLVDAREAGAPARPMAGLDVTQTLDDRSLKDGSMTLEIKATANGLVPKFEELFDFQPVGFKVNEITDSGPAVQRLASDSDELAAASERNWLIKLNFDPNSKSAAAFQFPRPKGGEIKIAYKRYHDADLVEVSPEIALAGLPLRSSRMWPWMLVGTVLVVTAVVVPMRLRRQTQPQVEAIAYSVPAVLTPFTTLQLLRQMHADERLSLSSEQRGELAQSIARVESHYFAPAQNDAGALDLASIARSWVQRVQKTD